MRKSSLGILLLVILFTGVGEAVALAGSKDATGPTHVLRFRNAEGWGAPSVKVSDDRFTLTLGFRSTPKDPVMVLDRILTERSRRVFSHAQVRQGENRTFVDLQLSRPLKAMKRKKYLKNNWLVRVELKPFSSIEVPSYASVFPEGLEQIVVEETERSMEEGESDCGGVNVLREDNASWHLYAGLLYAECLQSDRKFKDARKIARRVIREASPESPLGLLMSLRINQWKRQKAYPVEIGNITWSTLPAPMAQELGLRLAQRTYSRDLERAVEYFLGATSAGPMNEILLDTAQSIRFDLIQRSLDAGLSSLTLTLADALPLPRENHPSYKGTARACALTWSEAGRMLKSANSASVLLPQGDALLVDGPLTRTLEEQRATLIQEANQVESNPLEEAISDKTARSLTPPIKNLAPNSPLPLDELGALLGLPTLKTATKKTPEVSEFNIEMPKTPTANMPNELELALALQSKGSKQRVTTYGETPIIDSLAIMGGE